MECGVDWCLFTPSDPDTKNIVELEEDLVSGSKLTPCVKQVLEVCASEWVS